MKKLLNKQEKFIKYCIFGVLISIIEILLYCILSKFINLEPLIANSIAFILSVLMSYYANSKYVFKTIFISKKSKIKRFYLFLGTRTVGLFIDSSILYLLLNCPNIISKTISCISTTLINYYIGKYIFKWKKDITEIL
mgnify:CR=1 FL=1